MLRLSRNSVVWLRSPEHQPFNRMIPNMVTLLGLCAGMTAIQFALAGKFEAATLAIVTAGIFDGLDGRIARLLNVTSDFGAQLDSLSDLVCFGLAPGFLLYIWTVSELSILGWAIVVLFCACCALRLARFNTQIGRRGPRFSRNFFTGIPAPAGAGLVMVPMFFNFDSGSEFFRAPLLNGAVLATVSAFMVSRVPTFSIKSLRVSAPIAVLTLLTIGCAAIFFHASLWSIFLGVGAAYVSSIPISICAFWVMRRREATGALSHKPGSATSDP